MNYRDWNEKPGRIRLDELFQCSEPAHRAHDSRRVKMRARRADFQGVRLVFVDGLDGGSGALADAEDHLAVALYRGRSKERES